ncbi:MFS transporter [Patescibacteria group bacterium]|nr:MFS transporter [Patescibacteria group bacterium]
MLHFVKSFLPNHMQRQMRELFVSTTLVNLALAMVIIFEPIYLYQSGYSLNKIMFFYFVVYALYLLIVPIGAKFSRRFGYEQGILVGTIMYIVFYLALFAIGFWPWMFFVAPILYAIQKMFYWPAYHADFARFSDNREEGRSVSSITAITSLVYILGPVLAGFLVSQWGYGALFTVASIIFLTSNIATLVTKEKFNPGDFNYKDAYKSLFSKENRQSFLAYAGYGEELVVMVIWPVFISIVIVNLFDLGLVVTLATLVTTVALLYIGKLTDSRNKRKILSLGAVFYSLAWFFRIFVSTTAGVFFVDTMSRLGKNVVSVPLVALTYEQAKLVENQQKKTSVMNRVIFFEMSLIVGKILAIIAIYILTLFVADEVLAFKITFILAGGMSLFYMLL